MLALLDSLLRDRRPSEPAFDTIDQARRFLAWLDGGEYTPDGDGLFDIGRTTSEALARLHVGAPAELAGGTDEGDSGNGSLMRILPLALVERDISAAELVDHAHRSSAITHGNELAQATCALYVLSARCLLGGAGPAEALRLARLQLRTTYERGRESHARLAALGKLEAWTARSGSGYVVDSFWSGWDAFAAAASFQQTVENAIKYGHDTDTTACVAGGLAGIWYGRSGIPEGWLRSIRGADTVGRLVARLLGTVD
jgi:ADP-ribosylglycohydrolase